MEELKKIEQDLYDVPSRQMRNEDYLEDRVNSSSVKIPTEPVNYPDARMHQIVSFIKSGVRIAGYLLLAVDQLVLCAIVLILSEMVGIYEEVV